MSYSTCPSDNFYQTYQDSNPIKHRKGKFKKINNLENSHKKIVQYKKKNNIGENIRISEYDVYKASLNKKLSKRLSKSIRTNGYDYKDFAHSNQTVDTSNQESSDFINRNNAPEYDDCYDNYDDDEDYQMELRRERLIDRWEEREFRWERRERRQEYSKYMW